MLDIMFYEAFEEEERALRKHLPDSLTAAFTRKTVQEAGDKDLPASVISIRTQSLIPVEWGQLLEGILTRSQGYDHLKAYCSEAQREIPCGYLEEYCSRAVAEHALMAMLFLMRKTKKQMAQIETFDRNGLTGTECWQKKALVIGVGRIGSQLVSLLQGLDLDVKGVDIAPKNKALPYVPLEEGLGWADIVFCCVPLTRETDQMLNYTRLAGLPNRIWLINISRGEITPFFGLLRLIEERKVRGVSLDVYENEKDLAHEIRENKDTASDMVSALRRLKEKDNVLLTPHNAFNTREAVDRKAALSIQSLVKFRESGEFLWTVP